MDAADAVKSQDQRSVAAQETMEVLYDLSQLLNTGLSREQLRACVELVDSGVNAEAVAMIVKILRREASKR
ncbi:uncharacterized protein PFL1_02339 [Pseudozyma flocculosa PF-1]|uniref:Mitotic-spindle organizing protein 1 n=1 Tax=Pseudozyma flocculosa TaxID=84751 RepID=A0A5C3F7Z4_9BASI|nr:uncharacterized protein PFL1_02339 [Pseudozyma flocculosa PF-1]EPQ30223.1 hypothetical protein PFL1_02339 [Pseudozyma flocculosa PF-1]SPO39847.1 uncharacterized protein PSFLO_05328 [Pseudozyma flocculosa]